MEPRRPVWLAAFMDEENTRFNTALFGSAFCGEDLGGLGDRRDADGVTLAEAMGVWAVTPTGTARPAGSTTSGTTSSCTSSRGLAWRRTAPTSVS